MSGSLGFSPQRKQTQLHVEGAAFISPVSFHQPCWSWVWVSLPGHHLHTDAQLEAGGWALVHGVRVVPGQVESC